MLWDMRWKMREHLKNWLPAPELRKKAANRLLASLVWLAIITLLRWHWRWSLIWLWLGGMAGTFLLEIDHLLYTLVVYPEEAISKQVKQFLTQRQVRKSLVLLATTSRERVRLTFHTALFQPVLYVVCFFVLTSTGSLFGAGLVMAMALHLLREEISFLLQGKEEDLQRRFFWQIKTGISLRNQKFFVIFMLLVFLGLNLLLI